MAIPENIEQLANDVRTKVYGREVREALASGIEAAGSIANDADVRSQETETKQTSLEKKYDEQIANMSLENPNVAEVVDARVSGYDGQSYTTIGKRFDSVDAQLAQIAINVTNYTTVQTAIDSIVADGAIYVPDSEEISGENYLINKAMKIKGKGILKKAEQSKNIFIVDLGVGYNKKTVVFEDITIDGNEQGVINTPDVFVKNVGTVIFRRVKFKNPSKTSVLIDGNVNNAKFIDCEFIGGFPFSGSVEATATFHIKNLANCKLTVVNSNFETDITFNPGDGTQAGVLSAAPIAIYSINAIMPLIKGNRFKNAGNIDLYSLNHKALVESNIFDSCHHPAIKVQESRDIEINGNIIQNNLCKWGYSIIVQGYPRASTYGSLAAEQYYGIIANNVIDTSANGGIVVNGTAISPEITARDASITDDLIVYGYLISENEIRNTQQNAILLGYAAQCKIESNYIRNFGLSNPTSAFNAAGIVIQKPKGLIEIEGNMVIGDGVNSKFCIVDNYDSISTIIPGSVVRAKNNFTKGTTNYPIFFKYIETVEVSDNHCTDDFSVLIRVELATNATVNGNTGFDLSSSTKMNLVSITNLITDYRRKAKNISHGTAAPTTGTWSTGDLVHNTAPTAGGYMGWVCVSAGTPGIWKGFGAIQA